MYARILSIIKSSNSPEQKAQMIIDLVGKKRSSAQNRALHLYFTFIANELNNLGLTFEFKGLRKTKISIPYTSEIVKEYIWKPIQFTLYKEKSTTKLTTKRINEIIDIINNFFAEKGVFIEFPSYENLFNQK